MASYQLLFSGDLVAGAEKDAVQENLARELGIDARKSQALFSGRTVVLKSQLDEFEAQHLQQRYNDMGALCRIKNLEVQKVATDPARFKGDNRNNDHTLRDITAAHLECPRCSHLQLDTRHCARCGVDMVTALKQKRKEDLIIEKKIRSLRSNQTGSMPAVVVNADAPEHFGQPVAEPANDSAQRGTLGKMTSWLRRKSG